MNSPLTAREALLVACQSQVLGSEGDDPTGMALKAMASRSMTAILESRGINSQDFADAAAHAAGSGGSGASRSRLAEIGVTFNDQGKPVMPVLSRIRL